MSSCGGGVCQSGGCLSNPDNYEDGGAPPEAAEALSETVENISIAGEESADRLCSKCGVEPQACNNGYCSGCFRVYLNNKFKIAVTSNAMISPTDNLLIAFSGGCVQVRVALQFIHEMQYKSVKNWDASKSHALPVFGVGVAFVDESSFSGTPRDVMDKAIEDVKSTVSELAPQHKELHIIAIEGICLRDNEDSRSRLHWMLETVADSTGREDFVQHLRMLCLQKIAVDNGYSKLILGSCTSRIARHIISATVKGQGFSLPADLQYVDARWEVPVVLPLRDCLYQELSMLCHLDGLKTLKLPERPCTGINSLVSSFVTRLQEENPSRERTILRTAEKLKPFSFNKLLENGYHDFLPSRIRPKFQNAKDDDSTSTWFLCPICGSPLSESDLQWSRNRDAKALRGVEIFVSHCCESCYYQILPKEADSLERFLSFLPQPMFERALNSKFDKRKLLRDQIEDYLLPTDDDVNGGGN